MNFCGHGETTEPIDGYAICLRCTRVVRRGKMTEAEFRDTAESLTRHPHRKTCVRVDGGWICAADCPAYRPAA